VTKFRLVLVVAALAVGGAGAACGDDASGGTTGDNNGANNGGNNGGNNGAGAALRYSGSPSIGIEAGLTGDVAVEYVDGSGAPISDAVVNWEIVGTADGTELDAFTSTTNGDGIATMTLRAGTLEAVFEVHASVADDTVEPLPFTVTVSSKEAASYVVEVRYDGARSYTDKEIKVALYDMPESCADFNPLAPGTAERNEQRGLDAQGFPTTFTFRNLPNGDKYTVVATALAADSDTAVVIGSYGCNDSRPEIVGGSNPDTIVIDMTDRLPDVTGTWQVTSRFNLSEALPESVRNVLDPILDFFTDPEGTLVALASQFLQDQFNLDAGSVQSILESVAEDLLGSVFDGNDTVRDILTAGGDISEIIRRFHLQGNLTVPDESYSELGQITAAEVAYFNLGYRWRLNCEEGEDYDEDPTCGDAFISFDTAGLTPVEGNWDGSVTPNPDYDVNTGRIWFHELNVAAHTVDFNYGAVVAFLLEKVALPLLFDPTVDSLNALLVRFIDCDALFDTNLFATVCTTALEEVSNLLRDQLTGLSFSTDNFTLATPDTKPCALYEQDGGDYGPPEPPARAHDPIFSAMGRDLDHADHGDLRCEWEAAMQFSADPEDRSTFSGAWFGEKR
jgi:hypothetical protein